MLLKNKVQHRSVFITLLFKTTCDLLVHGHPLGSWVWWVLAEAPHLHTMRSQGLEDGEEGGERRVPLAASWPTSVTRVWTQLFWEKKLSGLSAFDIAEELVRTMDLPKGLQGEYSAGAGLLPGAANLGYFWVESCCEYSTLETCIDLQGTRGTRKGWGLRPSGVEKGVPGPGAWLGCGACWLPKPWAPSPAPRASTEGLLGGLALQLH